ncbi:DnaJ subfamily A member 3, mitochondrial [Liparis tanakae]|uniref:DnaJ subfamily A member 3, mitochondrial n=1 Tax=Liparis tanakae TaxID=230148 RepID=A0A4Z2ESR3_9TELE|nr:DnaJ subfamily A member 3, mitochondrial [Liparis tanakae]
MTGAHGAFRCNLVTCPQIPASCPADQVIRLQGEGVRRRSGSGSGDHYAHIKVRVPKKLTPRQRALLLLFAEDELLVSGSVNGLRPRAGRSHAVRAVSGRGRQSLLRYTAHGRLNMQRVSVSGRGRQILRFWDQVHRLRGGRGAEEGGRGRLPLQDEEDVHMRSCR